MSTARGYNAASGAVLAALIHRPQARVRSAGPAGNKHQRQGRVGSASIGGSMAGTAPMSNMTQFGNGMSGSPAFVRGMGAFLCNFLRASVFSFGACDPVYAPRFPRLKRDFFGLLWT